MLLRQDMHIYIDNLTPYDNNGNTVYKHQLSDIIEFVTEYRLQGGPEQPIRYLEMKVDKNDIDLAHPHLIDTIVEGKTRLLVKAVDGGTFIITKLWLTNNSYDLVATGIEITLNTATLSADDYEAIKDLRDPPSIIKVLFTRWRNTLNLSETGGQYEPGSPTYNDDFKIYFSSSYAGSNSETPRSNIENYISFKEDMPTLVAMNMCALLDNAFVFFANKDGVNTLYYVSYDDIHPLAYNPADAEKNGVVNIYPGLSSQYINYSKFDLMMFQRLIGISSKNSEGSETIVNNQIVSMEGGEGTGYNDMSIAIYGDYAGTKVMSDLMVSYDYGGTFTAEKIAKNIVRRYKDPTRSITFILSEVVNKKTTGTSGWEEQIPPFSYAYKIYDSVNNITLTNTHLCESENSSDKTDNFMLRLSTFIRSYPEMTTEYTFGVMKETTLSQELANKLTGMSGNVADLRVDGESIVKNGIVVVDTTPSSSVQTPDHLVTSHGAYTFTTASIQNLQTAILGAIYPVGAIYMNVSGTLPALISNLGTWTKIGEGSALMTAGTNYASGTTYGANAKTIAINEIPQHEHSISAHTHTLNKNNVTAEEGGSHNHSYTKPNGTVGSGISGGAVQGSTGANTGDAGAHTHGVSGTTESGGDGYTSVKIYNSSGVEQTQQSFNVMQQSLAVHMWRRTA